VLAAVDMFPTVCRLAEAQLPTGTTFDGIDRSDAFRGKPLPTRGRAIVWEYGRNAKSFAYPKQPRDRSPNLAIRDGRWKLLVNADGSGTELYDLAADPGEEKNLVAGHPTEAARLKKVVLDWRRSLP
jgi:arylsulfatase A-like enzyme